MFILSRNYSSDKRSVGCVFTSVLKVVHESPQAPLQVIGESFCQLLKIMLDKRVRTSLFISMGLDAMQYDPL